MTQEITTGEVSETVRLTSIREATDAYRRGRISASLVRQATDNWRTGTFETMVIKPPSSGSDDSEGSSGGLLDALEQEADTIDPPWEREGYESKQAWLDAQE